MLRRSEAREIAMIVLYQREISNVKDMIEVKKLISLNVKEEDLFVSSLVFGVIENEEKLEALADKYLVNWKFKRLDKLGGIILKIALYELLETDTPRAVVINEAVTLAKKYCDEDLFKMINAVLDRYVKE